MAHSANGDWHYDDASWRTCAVPTRGSGSGGGRKQSQLAPDSSTTGERRIPPSLTTKPVASVTKLIRREPQDHFVA
jgi:hypothetical protein